MSTSCGLLLAWNGRGEVLLIVPKTFGKYLTGICGNCDGIPNDYVTKDGKDVSRSEKRDLMIGKSFLVDEKAESSGNV